SFGIVGARSGGFADRFDMQGAHCDGAAHLYCYQTDFAAVIPAPSAPASFRYFFIAEPFDTSTGLAGGDTLCGTKASAASLPGTYKAVLPTSTASAMSRFTTRGVPIVRPDFVRIAQLDSDLLTAWRPLAPALLADGSSTGGAGGGVLIGAL